MMSGVVGQGLGVFGSYIATPVGAALLLALLVVGALRLIHRSSRLLTVALPVVGAVFGLPQMGPVGGFQHHRVSVPRRYGPFPEGF